MSFFQLFEALQTESRRLGTDAVSPSAPSSALFLTHGRTPRVPVASLSLIEPIPAANDNEPLWNDLRRSTG